MDQNESIKLAKEICQSFLAERINETQRVYEQVAACKCNFLGGKSCKCTNDDTYDIQTAKGGTAKVNGKPTFSISFSDILPLTGDEKDSAFAKRNPKDDKTEVLPAGHVASMIRACQMASTPVNPPKIKASKPLIKQSSFMEQEYDGIKDPYVIMINNVNFEKRPAPRNGAEADTKNLRKFLHKAQFNTVKCHFDLKKDEMMSIFKEAQKDFNLFKHDGLICFVMSHGNNKGIATSDNKYIKVDDITALFRGDQCPHFATKPKLFFIQACRGDFEDDGYIVPRGPNYVVSDSEHEGELPVKMPSDSDFLIAYSTTKEKCSYRRFVVNDVYYADEDGLSMGSWFIASLVDVLLAYAHEEDLLSMLTRVNKAMAELYTDKRQKQISCHLSMLTKKVFFPKFMEK